MVGKRRQICMQIVAGVLIFLSGIIIGSGGTVLWVKDRIAWIHPPHEVSMVPEIVEHFKSDYNLTEEQARQVKKVFQEGIETRMSIYEEAAQNLEKHEKTLAAKMKEILSAEQYKQWVSDFSARKEHFERFGPRGPGGPGPRGPGIGGPGPRGPGIEGPGPGEPGPRRFGPGWSDPNKPGQRPGPRRFGPARTEPNRPGPARRDFIQEPNRAPD